MLRLTQRKPPDSDAAVSFTLALSAEERIRSRYRWETKDQIVFLRLPRGTVLRDGDLLTDEDISTVVRVIAKPEPVLVVTAASGMMLLRAAYHLGNRHVPVEVAQDYLRLSPDPVLRSMLEHLGMQIAEAVLPFQPEIGAYGHHHHE